MIWRLATLQVSPQTFSTTLLLLRPLSSCTEQYPILRPYHISHSTKSPFSVCVLHMRACTLICVLLVLLFYRAQSNTSTGKGFLSRFVHVWISFKVWLTNTFSDWLWSFSCLAKALPIRLVLALAALWCGLMTQVLGLCMLHRTLHGAESLPMLYRPNGLYWRKHNQPQHEETEQREGWSAWLALAICFEHMCPGSQWFLIRTAMPVWCCLLYCVPEWHVQLFKSNILKQFDCLVDQDTQINTGHDIF